MAEPSTPFDAGDAGAVKDLIRDAKHIALRRKETLRAFMASKDGRAWFYELLKKCHIYHNPFSSDALIMACNCGEMNIGQQVLVDIEAADPALYLLMVKEGNEDNA